MNNGLEMRLYFLFTHSMELRKKYDTCHLPHYALLAHYFLAHYILMKVTAETYTKNIQLDQINVQSITLYFKQFCVIISLLVAVL